MRKIFLILLLFAALTTSAQIGSTSAVTSVVNYYANTVPLSPDNLVLWIDPSNTSTMLQEQGALGTPVTNVFNDGDPVGTVYDRSANAHVMYSDITGNVPVLATSSSKSCINFTSDNLAIENSINFFSKANYDNQVFSIMAWLRRSSDGVAFTFSNKTSVLTTVEVGITCQLTTANKVRFQGTKNSSGNPIWDITTTTSLVTADGWQPVFFEINGSGTGTGRVIIGNNAAETFNVSSGITSNPTVNMKFNGTAYLGTFIMLNRAMTSSDIAWFKTYSPTRTSVNFTPILQWDLDPSQTSKIYSDAGETTNVSTTGTAVRSWFTSQSSNFGILNRKVTSTSSGTSPVWTTNVSNSQPAMVYDGTDDNFVFSTDLTRERGGKYTIFIVFWNQRTVDKGSHVLMGTEYVTITGKDYHAGVYPNTEYFTVHTNGLGVAATAATILEHQSNAGNVLCIRRDGTFFSQWAGVTKDVSMNPNYLLLGNMGAMNTSLTGNWNALGNYFRLIKYTGVMNDAEVQEKRTELKNLYGF